MFPLTVLRTKQSLFLAIPAEGIALITLFDCFAKQRTKLVKINTSIFSYDFWKQLGQLSAIRFVKSVDSPAIL